MEISGVDGGLGFGKRELPASMGLSIVTGSSSVCRVRREWAPELQL